MVEADKVTELHDVMVDTWKCVLFAKKSMDELDAEDLASPTPPKQLSDFLHWRGMFEKAAERYITAYLEGEE